MQLEAIILRSNYSCLIDAAEVRASRMPVVLDHQLLRTVISTASSPWLSPTSFPTVVAKLFFYLCCCLFFILITKYSGIFLFKYPSLPPSLSLSLSSRFYLVFKSCRPWIRARAPTNSSPLLYTDARLDSAYTPYRYLSIYLPSLYICTYIPHTYRYRLPDRIVNPSSMMGSFRIRAVQLNPPRNRL